MNGRLRRFLFGCGLGAFGASFLVAPLPAQVQGSIRGAVLDSSGYPIRACVTLKSELTGVEKQTPCAPDGSFALTGLVPGTYSVTVMGLHFVTKTYDKVIVNSESPVPLQVELKLGPTRIEIGPRSAAAPVDTTPRGPEITPCGPARSAPPATPPPSAPKSQSGGK